MAKTTQTIELTEADVQEAVTEWAKNKGYVSMDAKKVTADFSVRKITRGYGMGEYDEYVPKATVTCEL
jgi:hypothetical protein